VTCQDVRRVDLLTEYLGGELGAPQVAALEQHLVGCGPCAAHVDLYRRITCREFIQDYLADYVAGALDPRVTADLSRHLEICPACRAYVNTYRRTRDVVGQVGEVEMPPEVQRALRAFLLDRLGLPHPDPPPTG
jgi:anti-sigma factor RsiW